MLCTTSSSCSGLGFVIYRQQLTAEHVCAQGGSFPQLLREPPAGRGRACQLAASSIHGRICCCRQPTSSRPADVAAAHPLPDGGEMRLPRPIPTGRHRTAAPYQASPHRCLPRGSRKRDAEEWGEAARGLMLVRGSCCSRRRRAHSPPRALHNGNAQQGRAPRAPPRGKAGNGKELPVPPWPASPGQLR